MAQGTATLFLAGLVVAWTAGCTTRPTPPRGSGAPTSLTVAEAEWAIFQDPTEPPRLIRLELDDTEKGIRAVVTSDDPYVVPLIQAHADRVSKLVTYGSHAGRVPVPPRPE